MTVLGLVQRMRGWPAGDYRALLLEEGGEVVACAPWREQSEDVYSRELFVRHGGRRAWAGPPLPSGAPWGTRTTA